MSAELFTACGLSAAPGQKVQGYCTVPGTDVKIPMTLINGAKPGKTVVITGGTHGGEYPGVETAIRIAAKLDPQEMSGRVAVMHPANAPAFFAKTQYISPLDGKNLNRVYPGRAAGTVSERIAYLISSELFSQADFYMDLHGGDIHENLYPFIIFPIIGSEEVQRISYEACGLMGIRYKIDSDSSNGTYGAAALMGVPGFLAEIGGCGRWNEEQVATYLTGVENVLRYLNVIPGEATPLCETERLRDMLCEDASATGCWYPAVEPGQAIKAGDLLGVIRDCFGNQLAEYRAPQDGVMLYIVSSLAINEGEPVTALGI